MLLGYSCREKVKSVESTVWVRGRGQGVRRVKWKVYERDGRNMKKGVVKEGVMEKGLTKIGMKKR